MSLVFSLGMAIRQQTGGRGATSQPPAAPPVNIALPLVTGTAQLGQVLTGDPGAWMGSPTGYALQWRRGAVAIIGATAMTYTLQAADLGQTISLAVTAANAAGSTTAISEATAPVGAASSDYFVAAIQGQSGAKYATTMERNGPFNAAGMTRPAITGTIGRVVEMDESKPGGVVDLAVDDTNFHTATDGYIVSRGGYAVTSFMKFMDPTREPIFLLLTKSGRSMAGLANDDDDTQVVTGSDGLGWKWSEYKTAVDYVAANYGPVDLLVTHWYGTSPKHIEPAIWMGELQNGTPHILGRKADNTPGEPGVDHYLMDIKAAPALGNGAFPYNQGLKLAYSLNPNDKLDPPTRAEIVRFFEDPRLAPMNLGAHFSSYSGHIEDALEDGPPMVSLSIMGPPILKALGYNYQTPTIKDITGAGDFAVEVVVDLPNGGNLSTVRGQLGIAEPASPAPVYLPVYGFEVAAPGAAASSRTKLARTAWTAQIIDAGTGTAPNRTGRVRLTSTTAIPNLSQFTYRQGGALTSGDDDMSMDQMAFFNFLVEEVPALKQPGARWPFPGFEVASMNAMKAVSMIGVQQPLAASGITSGTTAAIPAGTQPGDLLVAIADRGGAAAPGADAVWKTAAALTGGAGNFSFRVATRVYAAGDAAPVFANASAVEILRFGPGHTVGNTAMGTAAAGSVVTAPALAMTGASAWDVVAFRSRFSNQNGWGSANMPDWVVQTPNTDPRKTYVKAGPVTSLPAKDTPTVVGGSAQGGAALHIEIVRP